MLKRVAENGGDKEASAHVPTATGKEWKDVENLANEVAAHPEMFVGGNEALAKRLAHATKHFFDLGRTWEDQAVTQHGGPLPELTLEGFEAEQLFEQLALHHTPLLRYLRRQTNNFAKGCERRPQAFFPFMPLTEEEDEELRQEELLDDGEDDEGDHQDGAEEEEEMEDADEGEEEDEDDEEEEDDELGVGSMNGADVSVGDEDDDEDGDEAQDEDDDEDEEEEEEDADVDVKQKKKTQQQQQTKKKAAAQTSDHFFSFEDMDRFVEEGEMLAEKERDEEDGIRTAEDRDEEDDIEDAFEDIEAEDEEGELDMEMMGGLDEEDDEEDEDDDEEEDDGEDLEGDEEAGGLGGDIRYDHFFDAPEGQQQGKKGKKATTTKGKGSGGHLEEQIEELEDKIVGTKPWQLRGEVNNRKRPINSLLEEHVEFETAIKQAPVITEEVTMALEDIIKQRIIEGSFDDVVRKEEDEVVARRAPPELDFQKSQKSLAELYEEEYLKSVDKAAANPLAVPEEKKKTKEQEEVLRRFAKLAYQLDALSNFHFTPKPIIPEVAIKENVAAIRMEEIIPVGVSDSSLLAPQEVFAPDRRDNALPARDSASQKKLRRKRRKSTGLKPGAGLPAGKNVKRAERTEGGPMTSTKLFKQLTHEAQTTKGAKLPKARPQDTAPKRSATALKL